MLITAAQLAAKYAGKSAPDQREDLRAAIAAMFAPLVEEARQAAMRLAEGEEGKDLCLLLWRNWPPTARP